MRDRLVMGPILVAAVIGLLWLEQRWGGAVVPPGTVIGLVMLVFTWLGAGELAVMARAKGVEIPSWHVRLCAFAGQAAMFIDPAAIGSARGAAVIWGAGVLVLAGSMALHARHRDPRGVTAVVGVSLLAFVFLGLAMGAAFALRREHSAWVLLWVVLTAKACDIGAYFTGRMIGRHKLIPWLSPGKTWEGLAGGVTLAAAVGGGGMWLLERLTGSAPQSAVAGIAFGALAALLGQAGDLMASFLKRDAGLKDSGRSIPGMGGVLDVIDSPLLVLPAAYWWLVLVSGR